MIKGLRVDHRLLHGQVAVAWFNTVGANTILIANDAVAADETRKKIMRMAKPANGKLVIKDIDYCIHAINTGLTDKYDMFVVVENVKDAYRLITETKVFDSLNLGGTPPTDETRNISKTINVTKEDERLLDELAERGIEVEIRQVPAESKLLYVDARK
ncbi:PTS sugar transporter subunit IIB [Allofustis seminis]|uniref:PTS sugar transporter subunit IIB n=1 Tax=Allofustis seminis TaxID=166939 RepID=UPI00037CE8E6|nr:PTS sugar transporter subunit IIB [Allofustis seminis]